MFQNWIMYVCLAALAFLVPLCVVLWFHERGIRPISELVSRFRRLHPLAQMVLLIITVNLIVYGSTKSPTNDVGGVSGGTTNETGSVEGGTTNGTGYVDGGEWPGEGGSSPTNEPPPLLSMGWPIPGTGSGQDEEDGTDHDTETPLVNGFTADEIAAGFSLVRIGTNEVFDFSMPTGANEIVSWRLRGASQDLQMMAATGWPRVIRANGRVLDRIRGAVEEYGVFPAVLGIVPEANWWMLPESNANSRVWYRTTAENTFVVTWKDVLFGRDTNTSVSVQAEFFGNGNVTYRYDLSRAGEAVTNVLASVRVGTNVVNGLQQRLSPTITSLTWYQIQPEDLGTDDRDGDGISTYMELRNYGTDPGLWDTDGDGLGDAVEIALGTNPSVRDSDGDGLVDGSDPDPLVETSLADTDGDGIPDAYENHWFGDLTSVDDKTTLDATGFALETKIAGGMNPTNGVSAYNVVSTNELVSWKLWDGFTAARPADGTDVVFERTVSIRRDNSLQQFFLSSNPGAAGGWWLNGMTLEWEDSDSVMGTLTASPVGDSAYLPLSTNGASFITFRLRATADVVRSATPVYLVAYSPVVNINGGSEIELDNGSVAIVSTEGSEASFGVEIDRSNRPCKAALYPQEQDMSGLCSEGEGLSFVGAGGQGQFVVTGPGVYELPDFGAKGVANAPRRLRTSGGGGGSGRRIIIVLDPYLTWGEHHCYSTGLYWDGYSYSREYYYPLDSKCLWREWHRDSYGGWSCNCEASLSTGIGDCAYVDTDLDVSGDTATGTISVGGENVWSDTAVHTYDYTCGGESWDVEAVDECDEDCNATCANGNCGKWEGGDVKSLKFRIPTGTPRIGQISGFAYFDTDTPIEISPDAFRYMFRSDSQTTVTTNGSTRTVVCHDERGRTLVIEPMTHGARITITTTETGALEHSWEVWNVNGDTDLVRMRQISRLDNIMVDETYEYAYRWWEGKYGWQKTDNISGIREELHIDDQLNDGDGSYTETRIKYDADDNWLGSVERRSDRIGSGAGAVLRETYYRVDTGVNTVERWAEFWEDRAHAQRNGKLRLLRGDDCAWEYHDWNSVGREVLRVEQRNGSPVPTAFPNVGTFGAGLTGLAGLTDAFVTVYDYTPLSGDSGEEDDNGRVRSEIRYVVVNGVATEIGRTWHTYTHLTKSGFAAVKEETWRACTPGTGRGNSDNASSYVVTFDRNSGTDVPLVVRGEVAERLDEDGLHIETTVDEWSDRVVLTTRQDRGGSSLPTYTVEERDPVYGTVLRTATCLTCDDSVLDEVTCVYDSQNRLRSKTYSDGTSITNAYSCCRLLWSRDRKGRKVLRSAVTGEDNLYWADEEVWLADHQGGGHRVTQHFCDGFGRETNTVVYVGTTSGEATDRTASVGKAITEDRVAYMGEGNDWSQSVDNRGKTTTSQTSYYQDREVSVQESVGTEGSVVEETRTSVRNGRTVIRQAWDDKWIETVEETAYGADGCKLVSEWSRSSDYGVVTNRVTRYDFLGRRIQVVEPTGTIGYTYHGPSGRRDTATLVAGGVSKVTTTVYDLLGEAIGTSCNGVEQRSDVTYEMDYLGDWWKVVREGSFAADGAEHGVVETRTRQTGLGGEEYHWAFTSGNGRLSSEVVTIAASGDSTTTRRLCGADGEEVESVTGDTVDETTILRRHGLVEWRMTHDGTRFYSYDALGRTVSESRMVDWDTILVAEQTYTPQGDVATRIAYTNGTSGVLTSFGYDCYGNQVSETNANGDDTIKAYDVRGNLIEIGGAVHPERYGYDTSGRRTTLSTTRDGSNWDTTSWTYDPATGNALSKTYADGSQTLVTHTADGHVARTTLASGAWRGQTYDAEGRVTVVTSSDGSQDAVFGYDVFGRQTGSTGGVYSAALQQSDADIATNECVTVDGTTLVWQRMTDGYGRITGRGMAGGNWQTISYSPDGKIDTLSTPDVTITYGYGPDGSDGGATIAVAGGTTLCHHILRDRYTGLATEVSTSADGTLVRRYDCAYDGLSRLVARNGERYAYDAQSELTGCLAASTGSLANASYSYDGVGNFTAVQRGEIETAFAANAVNQYGGFVYNLDGCLLAAGGCGFTFDSACRLTSVSTAGVCVASYAYDPFDRRIMKTVGGDTHRYFYDGWNLVQERIAHANGTEDVTEYFWGKDVGGSLDGAGGVGGLVYVKIGGYVYVPVYDQNGNVVAYVDSTGATVAEYEYDGFGNTVAENGTLAGAFRFRYSTKYTDPETGLIYYGYRYYVPELGRWLTRDPLEEQGGVNLYGFCGNNGVNCYDVDGRLNFITALGHYVLRSGEKVTIPFADIDTSAVLPSDFKKVSSVLQKCKKDTYPIDDSMQISTMVNSINQGLYLGVVTLQLRGELFVVGGGYWRFAGKLSCSDDIYDFNRSNHRNWFAEALTFVGSLIPGKTYKIGISGEKPIWEYGNCCKNKKYR